LWKKRSISALLFGHPPAHAGDLDFYKKLLILIWIPAFAGMTDIGYF